MNELNAGMEVVKKFIQRWVSRPHPLPPLACDPVYLLTAEPLAPSMPRAEPLVSKGPKRLNREGLLGPHDNVWSEVLAL